MGRLCQSGKARIERVASGSQAAAAAHPSHASMMTLSALVLAALPKVS
jgi:hypothetical protein